MDHSCMYINLFKSFAISYHDIVLNYDAVRSDRIVKLLVYFLLRKGQSVTVDELSEAIWGYDEVDNPTGALKNLIYRCRTMMRNIFGIENCIITGRGSYMWNPDILLDSDLGRLDRVFQKLSVNENDLDAMREMVSIYRGPIFAKLADKLKGKSTKRLDDLKFPGFLSIFNENMVATSILMFLFFGAILLVLGKDYLVSMEFMKAADNFFFYIMTTALNFAVYLAILQLGVRTFVTELTNSFQGISNTFLPGAVPGIDCAAVFGFGSANAVTVGFLMGALGQFLAIMILLLMKSPTLVIAGFVPVFFDNAVIAIYADNRGGIKAAMLFPFISGLIQVFGSALIAGGRSCGIWRLSGNVRLGNRMAVIHRHHEIPRILRCRDRCIDSACNSTASISQASGYVLPDYRGL